MEKENVIGRIGIGISESARWIMKGRTRKQESDVIRIIRDPSSISDQDLKNYNTDTVKILSFLVFIINTDRAIEMIRREAGLTKNDIKIGIVREAYGKAWEWKLNLNAL